MFKWGMSSVRPEMWPEHITVYKRPRNSIFTFTSTFENAFPSWALEEWAAEKSVDALELILLDQHLQEFFAEAHHVVAKEFTKIHRLSYLSKRKRISEWLKEYRFA